MRAITSRVRSLWKGMRSSDHLEREMEEEMRHHLELHTERLIRERGLDARSAERVAKLEFGSIDNYKEAGRDVRGVNRLSGLSMDVKLGMRMLWKFPGLTIAGILTIAVAVGLAVSWFAFMKDIASPVIPLPEGNRLVQVNKIDVAAGDGYDRQTIADFQKWRTDLKSVRDLTAMTESNVSVVTEDKRVMTIVGARMTGSGFPLTRVSALLGRTINDADEASSAPAVVVLGYRVWQHLFDGDRTAIGKVIRVDGSPATVIGVMPEEFAFPINEGLWMPLKTETPAASSDASSSITSQRLWIAGRLAPGVTLKQAEAELNVIGDPGMGATAAAKTYRPTIRRYMDAGEMKLKLELFNGAFILFLLVVCANVGTLVFARTATREGEIAVRSVLGAGRTRIVMQLFSESLVLTTAGAALGLASAAFARPRIMAVFWEVQQTAPPFWFSNRIDTSTIIYTFFLALLAACVIGALPAMKATGKQLKARIAQPGSGGSGLRFGKMSTAVVVFQVALCVALLPLAYGSARSAILQQGSDEANFPSGEYLTATIVHSDAQRADIRKPTDSLAPDLYTRLRNRLSAEPGVMGVAFADRILGLNQGYEKISIEGDTTFHAPARVARIDENFFGLMHARIVAGRDFTSADRAQDARVAVVDTAWVAANLAGRNPLGVRINHSTDADRDWYRIVGVVANTSPAIGPGDQVLMYEPLIQKRNASAQVYLHVSADPDKMATRLQDAVTSVEPTAVAADGMSLKNAWRPLYRSNIYFVMGITGVAAIILAFALIGIYALMSFTVSQRAREIGIRCALGANPSRILASIFSRALMQVGLGVLVGGGLSSVAVLKSGQGRLVASIAGMMIAFGLIGCVIPAIRALRIQPVDALRAD